MHNVVCGVKRNDECENDGADDKYLFRLKLHSFKIKMENKHFDSVHSDGQEEHQQCGDGDQSGDRRSLHSGQKS